MLIIYRKFGICFYIPIRWPTGVENGFPPNPPRGLPTPKNDMIAPQNVSCQTQTIFCQYSPTKQKPDTHKILFKYCVLFLLA